MESALRALEHLYQTSTRNRIVVYTAGGGSQALGWLLGVPGASSVVLEASVPYATAAFNQVLDASFDAQDKRVTDVYGYCSLEASQALARRACNRALDLQQRADGRSRTTTSVVAADSILIGVGLTGAIATSREKKGDHRAYISTYDSLARTTSYEVLLEKGNRNRFEEDGVTSEYLVKAILEACNWEIESTDPPTSDDVVVTTDGVRHRRIATSRGMDVGSITENPKSVSGLVDSLYREVGAAHLVTFIPNSLMDKTSTSSKRTGFEDWQPFERAIVFPGSFNPFHVGHENLACCAQRQAQSLLSAQSVEGKETNIPIVFELAVENADKGMLSAAVTQARVDQFSNPTIAKRGPWPVALTRAPRFLEKARMFPNCIFVIGVDTGIRLIDPKYYDNSVANMEAAMGEIMHLGCKIMVAGRKIENKSDQSSNAQQFETYETLMKPKVPEHLSSLFIGMTEDDFRLDISSTEIRAAMANED